MQAEPSSQMCSPIAASELFFSSRERTCAYNENIAKNPLELVNKITWALL